MPHITIKEGAWYLVAHCFVCGQPLIFSEIHPDAPVQVGDFAIQMKCAGCHSSASYQLSAMRKVQATSAPPAQWTRH